MVQSMLWGASSWVILRVANMVVMGGNTLTGGRTMKLRELTTEHLGQVATDEDLAAFKRTIGRIRPAFDTEDEAIDWLYGEGDYMPRMDANITRPRRR